MATPLNVLSDKAENSTIVRIVVVRCILNNTCATITLNVGTTLTDVGLILKILIMMMESVNFMRIETVIGTAHNQIIPILIAMSMGTIFFVIDAKFHRNNIGHTVTTGITTPTTVIAKRNKTDSRNQRI